MCGFIVSVTPGSRRPVDHAGAMKRLNHRGPDDQATWADPSGICRLSHCRLSIIDLSSSGRQPMADASGRYQLVFNGEIYNYRELKTELASEYSFSTKTDTEVLLAAYCKWGEHCLDRLNGMFAFAIWDTHTQSLFVARDRFGVKPLFYAYDESGSLHFASEINALHEVGVPRAPHAAAWASYLAYGMYDHTDFTFWEHVRSVPAGGCLSWSREHGAVIREWYDISHRTEELDDVPTDIRAVEEALLGLLKESVELRFRSDVPVGVCLSGGLDSSLLVGLINAIYGEDAEVNTFTFYCDDARYDETPYVSKMLESTQHKSHFCLLKAEEVPELARKVQLAQDEPFGGIPTLGMAKVHEAAVREHVTVLLDGNGMDEGWAGYGYYARANEVAFDQGPVQGARSPSVRPDCLVPEFARDHLPFEAKRPFKQMLRNLQYRDIRYSKIPRAMRFADRVSMMASRELREPFLDYRILELGLKQPLNLKIRDETTKWLPRQVARKLLPQGIVEAPKQAVQSPQREWLRGPLAGWADELIHVALKEYGDQWVDREKVLKAWAEYRDEGADNSFPIWQWVNMGMMVEG